ncbi:MAG TPA: hypothetical protein VMI56_00560 [Reyranella sp.]|nr:hypothetical protein [Reyranella sp.]
MTRIPRPSSSPACLAHEADDTYMGFASREELAALLAELDHAGPGTIHSDSPLGRKLQKMLPRVRDDSLYRTLKARLEPVQSPEK